jgi:hypothetical protein
MAVRGKLVIMEYFENDKVTMELVLMNRFPGYHSQTGIELVN